LAELYGVPIKRLNEQVKRNSARFPADFIFRLTRVEEQFLRSQNATSKKGRGGRRYLPFVFSEHGAIMAATVLNSKRCGADAHFRGARVCANARSAGRESSDNSEAGGIGKTPGKS
jgi:hypothetical protein